MYPKMMYKKGGTIDVNIGNVDFIIVGDEESELSAEKDGYVDTPYKALNTDIKDLALSTLNGMSVNDVNESFSEDEIKSLAKEVKLKGYTKMNTEQRIEGLLELSKNELD